MLKKRTIDPDAKKEKVVAAARSLFVQHGFHRVSIPMIVRESGVSTGAIYNYFASKEEMATCIHHETLEEYRLLLEERLAGRVSTRDKLKACAELIFDITESDPDLMEYMIFMKHGEFMRNAPPICSTEPFLMIQEIIRQGMEKGEIRKGTPLLSAVSYTGVILRASALRLQGVLPDPLTEVGEELIGNAWAAVS